MTVSTAQMRFWSPEVRELEPYVPGEQPKIQNLLKLNTNENPYPPSPKVVEAVQAVLHEQADVLRLYPDPDATALKQAIAKQQNIDVSQVFVGNGSDEVLAHIFKAFFLQDEPILYPDITYSFYPVYSQFFGTKTKEIPLNENFEIDVRDYTQPNGGVIITNPNAPTSIALSLAEIEQVLQANPDRVVVIDEAYVDFGAESAVSLINRYENLVVCQTTSKSRSLAGLRVGFAIAQSHLIAALETVKNSFNSYPIDRFAIAAAVASFEDQVYFEEQCQKVITSREKLVRDLTVLGFNVLPSKANFIFATHSQHDAGQLAQKLREQGIIVRYFNKPRINQFLRITVGTDEQNARLVQTLKQDIL
ncbi:histidinol-phosphate transaminase [Acinetobacter baumannii]|jgi:histidinol phosphate aminotransferase apoenzyme (EC 2.6.1.9)|uniref:Histidinol-phosphate aminotransferase n=2 Tax=Acinetobacter baumannii TaxID=470 RepID=HIS8_ACIBT|nr:histidinol-phosphate transaminase [Acinetobacter baumannii]A3M2I8.2 RecName: Full=Histidinol-phosphate aminotransferase; AltName: Full=Imidazole acetol-phosphate transaminase [Acinetobacter baumannii ATCC 17978]ABO11132.2 histidinol-phosphate aminotransferase [Acinetobacter baumannii ATCC 17978]AKQ27995.1 histidinol-phosphate aminotransferase [Acinetobacter baumannii]APP31239.1 histidinol-phosphate transaminase [Acinetobacter baumannii]APX49706.1 histidinol-phosphate transaminase [Acinetoba